MLALTARQEPERRHTPIRPLTQDTTTIYMQGAQGAQPTTLQGPQWYSAAAAVRKSSPRYRAVRRKMGRR